MSANQNHPNHEILSAKDNNPSKKNLTKDRQVNIIAARAFKDISAKNWIHHTLLHDKKNLFCWVLLKLIEKLLKILNLNRKKSRI